MCDPTGTFSPAASIVKMCYIYGCEFADAPQQSQRLGTEVSTLAGLLVSVEEISSSSADSTAVADLQAVLDRCQQSLQDVSNRLKEHDPNTAAGPLRRLKNRARWPLSTNTTATLLATVESQ
jgi:uncharacterized coiled-coil protein SlyX